MKKIIWKTTIFLLVILMLLSAAACGKKDDVKKDETEKKEESGLVVQRTISPVIDDNKPTEPPVTVETADPAEPDDPETDTDGEANAGAQAPKGTVAVSYVSADGVNVRKNPSSEGEVLGQMGLNTIVYITNKDAGNDWTEISYNGSTAYIASYYLNALAEGAEVKATGQATINSTDINPRADDTTDSEILGKVSTGTKLDILKKDAGGDWTMVMHEGRVAYVASRYLDF